MSLPTPYYSRDGITIYHGDCREILPHLEPDSVDLVLTDPPYGVGMNYGDLSSDREFLTDWLPECHRISEGPIAFTIPQSRLPALPTWPDWIGIWHKPLTLGYWSTPFMPHWEAIAFYNVSDLRGLRSDVWTLNPARKNGHPTPKPTALFVSLVETLSGNAILDPFMGSGTTLRAAKDLGRRAIGIEIEERYCDIAVQRLQQAVLPLEASS